MRLVTFTVCMAMAGMVSSAVRAQDDKKVTKEAAVVATATIQAIDATTRAVTLRNERGEEDTFIVGPEVKRFNQLRVGDTIKVTYYESVVFQLRKPGVTTNDAADVVAGGRAKNVVGGSIASRQTRTVTVKAVDPAVPSITVVTQDNRTVTRKIENKKNLEGVKPGDRIDITYTEAVVVNAEPAK